MHVYTRNEWHARTPRAMAVQDKPLEAFIHHSDDPHGDAWNTIAEQEAKMRAIQNYHMDDPAHGWSDIAYHYVVFQPNRSHASAHAYEGRKAIFVPAAQLDHNARTLAICVVGDGSREIMQRNTRFVIEQLIQRHPSVHKIGGHRDVVSTTCPGDKFYSAVPRIADAVNLPHF